MSRGITIRIAARDIVPSFLETEDSGAGATIQTLERWLSAASQIVEFHGPEFGPIVARIERETCAARRLKALDEARRMLAQLRSSSG